MKGRNNMDETKLLAKIDLFIEENKENIKRDIKTLVDIPSVEGAALPGKPFGADVARALDAALDMARDAGLDAHNVDGYFGYADLPGESETQLATIAHLDVVPAGNGWTGDAFCMTEREGYLLGRGVCDDKGPAVLTLYAAKFFAEQGTKLPYTLRVMLGTNEESGMDGLAYYQERFAQPAFCFTPDAAFPVCFGEKGIYSGAFTSAPLNGALAEFSGGVAGNVVPDRATALVRTNRTDLPGADRIALAYEGDCVRITAQGKGGHASTPQGTVNAILLVADYLLDNALCSEQENAFLRLLHELLRTTDGSSTGIACADGVFTPLTCIGGTIALENGVLTQTIDVRYPTATTGAALTARFTDFAAQYGAQYACAKDTVPFVTSADTPMVQTMIDTYNEVTGKHEKPFTMGGGTYARHFPSAVSFGPEEEGEPRPDWVGDIHGANEGISTELLWRSLKIYILALARLMRLSF